MSHRVLETQSAISCNMIVVHDKNRHATFGPRLKEAEEISVWHLGQDERPLCFTDGPHSSDCMEEVFGATADLEGRVHDKAVRHCRSYSFSPE